MTHGWMCGRTFLRSFVAAIACAIVMVDSVVNAAGTTSVPLTLMTYNIHVGIPMGHDFGEYMVKESDLSNLAAVIQSSKPDVVGMQEVDCEFGQFLAPSRRRTSALNEPRMLANFTRMNYAFGSVQDDIKYPSDNAGYVEWGSAGQWTNNHAVHGEVGNCVLTSWTLKAPPQNIALPKLEGKERRACLRVALRDSQHRYLKPIIVYCTHLQHDSEESRVLQMDSILQRISKEKADSIIFLLGDFNCSPDDLGTSSSILTMARTAGLVDLHGQYAVEHGTNPESTYPADKPQKRIDFIMCNRPLVVKEARSIATLSSDHLPVLVTVLLP